MKQSLIVMALLLASCGTRVDLGMTPTPAQDTTGAMGTPTSLGVSTAGEPSENPQTIIYFYGDSISTGHGFGTKDNPSALNTIQGIANILLEANCSSGAFAQANRGQDFNVLYYDAKQGLFHGDDFILWENAGPTLNDAEMYRKWLELVLFATQGKAPLILTTTYDHGGFSDYNAPLTAGVSLNDAVRQFAKDNGTLLLDWDAILRKSEARTAPWGGSLLVDGIHPNFFGNFVTAASLLTYLHVDIRKLGGIPRLFTTEDGDVPDLASPQFHWGYNPGRRQRLELINTLLIDVKTNTLQGPAGLSCGP